MKNHTISLLCASILWANATHAEFMVGADLSAAATAEQHGVIFYDNHSPKDVFAIFKENGYNTIRLRLFLDADGHWGAVNNLPYTLNLAKRVKKHGFKFLLDLHYSDTWADPAHQHKPTAWADLSYEELLVQVHTYTKNVLKSFSAAGAPPDYVQIGNEITPGMLWPDGKIGDKHLNSDEQWKKLSELLKAGIRGTHDALRDHEVKIVIHIDRGGSKSVCEWFFSNLMEKDVDFDMIGLSYYPWMHGSLNDLEETLHYIGNELNKPVFIAETAFPHREIGKPDYDLEFEATPNGQSEFLSDLLKVVQKTPNEQGVGIIYWHPESVPTQDYSTWMHGATALFDKKGNALPAIKILAEAAKEGSSAESEDK